ncbi:MAG: GTPase ObgE [Candidatus Magnetoovum sp. WYHC-5]|nr:GTPase ObgE [Candidatus Magnetoovum sp. WYHC-5]
MVKPAGLQRVWLKSYDSSFCMKFVDYVKIYVKAGAGGRGCVSFRREKYVPKGGPDGGDGGKGGNIVFRAEANLYTLLDHRYKKHYKAKRGGHGMGKNMHGEDGGDLIIKVPVGTVVKEQVSEEIIADLNFVGKEATIAKGGRGGKGNAHFKSATMQTPRFAQPGEDGEEAYLILELKLLADVGLIGRPNAGKSTLISVISRSRPKIADYPFTTLVPNLGVVKLKDYRSFTVADIPGIIKNAHKGAGLGLQFLRHAERTSLLLHLVDVSEFIDEDPIEVMFEINRELALHSEILASKEQLIVGTKTDLAGDSQRLERLKNYCLKENLPFYNISAATMEGIEGLIADTSSRLNEKLKG